MKVSSSNTIAASSSNTSCCSCGNLMPNNYICNNHQHKHSITTTHSHLTNSLNPIQTNSNSMTQSVCCAKLVTPNIVVSGGDASLLTSNNKQSSINTATTSTIDIAQQQQLEDNSDKATAGILASNPKNPQETLYYSVFKLHESVDSPTTNMFLENGKLLYSPTTATSIVVKSQFSTMTSSINNNKPCNNNNIENNNSIKQRSRMNDSTSGESKLKIVQQRSSSNNSSDEDDTTALSGDSNYFDPCNEEDLESEETSDNSDEEEEDEEDEEEEEEEDNEDDYFDADSEQEEDDEEEEDDEDEENSNQFWFGIEEPCHVSRVLQLYCNFFKLNAGRGANSRLPIQFIGKICRAIISKDLFDDDTVRTFDIVDIYERTSNLQYGAVHRKLKTVFVETHYDNEGLPMKFKKRKSKDSLDETEHQKSSWLYSFPIYGTSEEYHYESSLVDKSEEIGYADLLNRSLQKFNCKCKEIAGSPNDSQFMYTPRQQDDDDDDDCDSDSDNSDCEGEDSSIPNYMKDLIPHLSGRGYLDTDICYGYFEDDK